MPAFATSLWKRAAILLLIALIGVYALYEWYGDRLRTRLDGQDAALTALRVQLAASEARAGQLQTETEAFRTRIATCQLGQEGEKTRVAACQAQAERERQDLRREQETQRQTQAAVLAAEQSRTAEAEAAYRKLAAAHAELQTAHTAAADRIVSLETDLAQIDTLIARAAAEHQAQVARLEQQLNERIELSRVTPADAELLAAAERMRLLADPEQSDQRWRARLDETQAALDAAQSSQASLTAERDALQSALDALQSRYDILAAEHDVGRTALDALQTRITVLETERDALQAGQAALAAERDLLQTRERTPQLPLTSAGAPEPPPPAALQPEPAPPAVPDRPDDIQTAFAALGARQTASGLLIQPPEREVRFPSGQATLPAGELPTLDRIAALTLQYPALQLRIEGHTDNQGSEALNQTLSQQRAAAIMQALIARGLSAERLSAVGLGSARPIADNATRAGRNRNRRVEVYVVDGAETAP